jgi:FkbM family methyltransferase
VKPGDWVLDVRANVGHYSHRLSDLVGPAGRIFAFEPVRETFELLTANVARFAHANVTLLNVTASDTARTVGMTAPVRSDDASPTTTWE